MRHLTKYFWARVSGPWILSCLIMALLNAAMPVVLLADGGYLGPFGYPIFEPAQTAFIRYDAATTTETLSIRPVFFGENLKDFAWVVPVPSLPEVAEEDPEIFGQLDAISAPVRRSRDSFWGCESYYDVVDYGPPGNGDGVEIIDTRLVGIYRTMTLGADDAGALTDSLTAWGFLHDDNRDTFEPVLQSYVERGWFFVTMVIDSTSLAEINPTVDGPGQDVLTPPEYQSAGIQPVRFTFSSAEIVYPLHISSISSYEDNLVNIYVAAAHRMDFPEARTLYANRITTGEWDAVKRRYPLLGAELWEGAFVTKLFRGYTATEMNDDLVLTPADHDAEYLPVSYSGFPVWSLVLAGTIAGWLIRKRRLSPERSRATDS